MIGQILQEVRKSPEPARRTLANLEDVVADFLMRGFEGATLTVHHRKPDIWVRFRKYIVAKGEFGIELCFSDTLSSTKYFAQLREYCVENNISFEIKAEVQAQSTRFLCVDCGRDASKAHGLAVTLLTGIVCLPENSLYEMEFRRILPISGPVDTPGRWRPMIKAFPGGYKEKLGVSFLEIVSFFCLYIIQLAGIVGLAYTIVAPSGNWRISDFELFEVSFDLPVTGLIWISVIFFGALKSFSRIYWASVSNKTEAVKLLFRESPPDRKSFRTILMQLFLNDGLNLVSLIIILISVISWIEV